MAIVTVPGAVAFDYGSEYADQRGWWTCCPVCGRSGLLSAHEVTHPYDEAKGHPVVNITPSCECPCGAHWRVTLGEVVMLDPVPRMGGQLDADGFCPHSVPGGVGCSECEGGQEPPVAEGGG